MSVLGIDAAWTAKNPSGVALLSNAGKLVAHAPSYLSFLNYSENKESPDWKRPGKAGGSISLVLEACNRLLPNDPLTVIAVDMPVSKEVINGRRTCDRMVSKRFGSMGCSTHSPNSERPGPISQEFSNTMRQYDFELAVHKELMNHGCFIEVYPHTALVRLMEADYRIPYKESKRSKYWPDCSTEERRANLIEEWRKIKLALEASVGSIELPLEAISLKAVEDTIDAIVCAWVGQKYLNGEAESLGDETSAIWTPNC